MCGCVEDMPEVSRADCSVPSSTTAGAFDACTNNDLLTRYFEVYPGSSLENPVGECFFGSTTSTSGTHGDDSTTSTSTTSTDDSTTSTSTIFTDNSTTSTDDSTISTSATPSDVTEFDFGSCGYNTYMCCWTENNNQGMQDNTVRSAGVAHGVCRSSLC